MGPCPEEEPCWVADSNDWYEGIARRAHGDVFPEVEINEPRKSSAVAPCVRSTSSC